MSDACQHQRETKYSCGSYLTTKSLTVWLFRNCLIWVNSLVPFAWSRKKRHLLRSWWREGNSPSLANKASLIPPAMNRDHLPPFTLGLSKALSLSSFCEGQYTKILLYDRTVLRLPISLSEISSKTGQSPPDFHHRNLEWHLPLFTVTAQNTGGFRESALRRCQTARNQKAHMVSRLSYFSEKSFH